MPIKNNDNVRLIDNGYGIRDERRISSFTCKVLSIEGFMAKIDGSEEVKFRRPDHIKNINNEIITQENHYTVNIGDDVLLDNYDGNWISAKVVNKYFFVKCGWRVMPKREDELQLEPASNEPNIKSFPTIKAQELEHIKDDDCPICMNKYSSMPVVKTNCNHYFHKKCISKWKNPDCPLCRQHMTRKGGYKKHKQRNKRITRRKYKR